MQRTFVWGVVVVGVWMASGRGQQPDKDRNAFMQLKLQTAQQALNGIAVGDFDQIEVHAGDLARLSKKAEFQLMKTPEYGRHSENFRLSAEAMGKAARAKNLDGTALAYVQLTLNCVVCHKYVREAR